MSFSNDLRNILFNVFNGIIVDLGNFSWDSLNISSFFIFSDCSLSWNSFDIFLDLIISDSLFEWNIFDT